MAKAAKKADAKMLVKASKKVVDEIRRLASEGKVECAGDISKIDPSNLDFTVTKADLSYAWHQSFTGGLTGVGFTIKWETVSAGFGECTFYTKGNKLYCDNEAMGKFFLANVLMRFLEGAELTDGPLDKTWGRSATSSNKRPTKSRNSGKPSGRKS